MLRTGISLFLIFLFYSLTAQVVINEASNRNFTKLYDEDGERNDWIELYNTGDDAVNLKGWSLSDKKSQPDLWTFGDVQIEANDFLLVHASGKDRRTDQQSVFWETAILPNSVFRYVVPDAKVPNEWASLGFNDSHWQEGSAGFGFGDDDDQTIIPDGSIAVFIRSSFSIADTSAILGAILHVDYDDGFIAYLNGKVIARSNVNENATWNTYANDNREAEMYNGSMPQTFSVDVNYLKSILVEGENIFAIQVHNVSNTSSDMSLIPFLSFALKDGYSFFSPTPEWFVGNTPGQLHANFKISVNGEMIYLSQNGVVADSLLVPKLMTDHSIGRVKNGENLIGIFVYATPGASNNWQTSYTDGYTNSPSILPTAGFFDSAVEVSIYANDQNATIRYTLDGSEPSTLSPIYTAPLRISKTQSIKARSFVQGKLAGVSATSTYFINEEYTLPVLSVTTTRSNLYGSNGIFTNYNQTINIPSYVEYFDKNKQLGFKQYAGMQVDGGAGGSRHLPQHSFRIEPGNGSLGDGDLKFKLMHRRPNRSNYPSFYLRNGSNQHNILTYKDGLQVTALGRNTYTYYSAYEPIVVYINGEYFGVYELREKINYDYLEDNYQMNIDSLDFLGVSYFKGQQLEALRGSIQPFIDDFNYFLDLEVESADFLSEVDQFLDIKSYTDYIIAESWVGNNDWPFNNIKLFRCVGTNMRWQWAINDLEWALNPNGWTSSSFDHIQFMKDYGTGNYYTGFWFRMMNNANYKAYFINRFADLMNTSYHFSEIGPLENEMFNEIYPEMDGQFRRWGSSNIDGQMDDFLRNHQTFRSELEKRSTYVRNHLQSHFGLKNKVTVTLDVEPAGAGTIQISTIVPITFPWEGIYFTNVPIEIEAIPNPGFQFDQWGNADIIDNIYQAYINTEFNNRKQQLKAYFVPDEQPNHGVVISEINYKNGKNITSPDWIEICNYSNENVNLHNWTLTDDNPDHLFVFDKDWVLAPGERVVLSNDYQTFLRLYPNVQTFPGEFSYGLGSPHDEINLFNEQGELVVAVHYSDHYPWPLSNDLKGRTLELRIPGAAPDNPMAWFRGCIGGSPGTAFSDCGDESVDVLEYADKQLNVKAYPNPAADFISIDIQLDDEDNSCSITVLDMMGNTIETLSQKGADAGWHTLQLNVEKVRSPIFFVKVNTNKSEHFLKMLKR